MTRHLAGGSDVRCVVGLAATLLAACGGPSTASAPRAAQPVRDPATYLPSPAATAPATQPTAGATSSGSLSQQLTFTWDAGYRPPGWLPASITSAPAAPTSGPAACGVNASRQFTALLQYSPASAAAAVTIQINGYRAPGSYVNTADASPVDVEVSPPGASQTGLSGFGAPGATVSIDPGATSGSVASPLLVDGRAVGAIHGRWRCA